nr:glutathione S-transferase theta-like 2 [Halisarca dujardinii]
MALKIFFDSFSQPCRAVLVLLRANNIPFEKEIINIGKGEHFQSDSLAKVNPNKTVPSMDDGGFCLFESAAIMPYLVQKYNLPDHWYPSNVEKRIKVDQYLHWHASNLRWIARVFFMKVIGKKMGREPNPAALKVAEKTGTKAVNILDEFFLKDTKFISSDEISVADLQALCEITQYWMIGQHLEADHPNIERWIKDCQAELSPHFDKVHKWVYYARDSNFFGDTQNSKL